VYEISPYFSSVIEEILGSALAITDANYLKS
jgi:hypothetical protein